MITATAICQNTQQAPRRRGMAPAVDRGFSMVELMVAMVLGLLLVLVIGSIFAGSSRSYKEDSRLSLMQQNGRFAISALSTDLGTAGFWATVTNVAQVTADTSITGSTANCGITLGASNPIQVLHSSTASTTLPCLPSSGAYSPYIPASGAAPDVVVVQRVLGKSIPGTSIPATGTPIPNTSPPILLPYLSVTQAGPAGALTVPGASGAGALVATNTYWQYLPRIYYICNFPVVPGSSTLVPSLCRWDILTSNTSSNPPTLVADSVEYLHVEAGIDTDKDGAINDYESSPPTTDLQTAVNLRLFLLVRSRDPDPLYVNQKTYNLGSVPITYPLVNGTTDNYYRRVYATTVPLRNIINRALLGS